MVSCTGEALLSGTGGAYGWPTGFMIEPWTEAELIVRIFRLLQSPRSSLATSIWDSRTEPLVLLADDDPELIELVEMTLRNDGISCRLAGNGLEALRLAREILPDLLVLDIKMPKISGMQVLETLRGDPALQALPVVLLTACQDPVQVNQARDLGADLYLAKPLNANVLLSRVKGLLSTKGRRERRWTRSQPGLPGSVRRSNGKRWIMEDNPYREGEIS